MFIYFEKGPNFTCFYERIYVICAYFLSSILQLITVSSHFLISVQIFTVPSLIRSSAIFPSPSSFTLLNYFITLLISCCIIQFLSQLHLLVLLRFYFIGLVCHLPIAIFSVFLKLCEVSTILVPVLFHLLLLL